MPDAMIPRAPVARIMVDAGAERVSASAVEVFSQLLEDEAVEIAKKAAQLAKHAGRKTITEADIRLALK